MADDGSANSKTKKKVIVSGCYDLLHSGHVEFFKEASQHGDVYVSVGSDANIVSLKGRPTMIPEAERLFMVQSIKYVHYAEVSPQMGMEDFTDLIDRIKPDIFFVNEDGIRDSKRKIMAEKGVAVVVAERKPAEGLDARSSTAIKSEIAQSKLANNKGPSDKAPVTLTYFNGRGRANPIRFVLAAARIPFVENHIVTHENFLALRDSGKLAFGQLPLLEVDGQAIVQSVAIIAYLAAREGLGPDPGKIEEASLVWQAVHALQDARNTTVTPIPIQEYAAVHDEGLSLADATSKVKAAQLPAVNDWLAKLEVFWADKGKPFLLGTRMTVADVLLFEWLTWVAEYWGAGALAAYPNLKANYGKVAELPQMADYLASAVYIPVPTGEEAIRYWTEVKLALGRP